MAAGKACGWWPARRWLYQQAVYDAIEKNVLLAGVTADPPMVWKPGMDIGAEAQEETLVSALKDEGCRQTATVKLEAGVAGSFDVEEQLKIESGEPAGGPGASRKARGAWNPCQGPWSWEESATCRSSSSATCRSSRSIFTRL